MVRTRPFQPMKKFSQESFLRDVSEHQMTIMRSDGRLDRHVRFRNPRTICYGFDLITWPGHLCITGDCGTYVFSRILDMFEFFRQEENPGRLYINPDYWAEKLLSISKHGGCLEFDKDQFCERVTAHFDSFQASYPDANTNGLWQAIRDRVLCAADDGEHAAYQAIWEFRHGDFRFNDFFDGGGTESYTLNFLWCLYAIVWGIGQYDCRHQSIEKG